MAWWHRAKSGDKIACIDTPITMDAGEWTSHPLVTVGTVWTISEVFPVDQSEDPRLLDGVWLVLEGVSSFDLLHSSKFRPVQPRKADISIFTDMLRSDERERESSDEVSA